MNFNKVPQYILEITVVDDGDPPLSDAANITILVTDANDVPVITVDHPRFEVKENVLPNTTLTGVGWINGSSVPVYDEDTADVLTWMITKNDGDMFEIDPSSGNLTVRASPDFETHPYDYSITVVVYDLEGTSDSAEVAITILDVNEAPESTYSTAYVNEDGYAGSDVLLGTPSTFDVDSSTFVYTIVKDFGTPSFRSYPLVFPCFQCD